MKPGTRRQTVFRITMGLGLMALAVLGTTSLCLKEIPLALFGKPATGTVRKVEVIQTSTSSTWRNGRSEGRGGSTTLMHIVFNTQEGTPVESRHTATFHTEARVGDEHPMIYLPWRPGNAKIFSAKQLWLPMTVGVIFSSVCGFLGQRCLRNKRIFPVPQDRAI